MNKLLVKLALLGCIASPVGARLREGAPAGKRKD